MKIEDIKNKLTEKINSGEMISPILFIWNNLVKNNLTVSNLALELLRDFWIDKNNIFKIEETLENIKVEEARNLMEKSFMKASDKFQIFIIENISRLSISSWNSLLKFLEEPWIWNIIFLTNSSESWVLETILSRCQTEIISTNTKDENNHFYYHLIDDFIKKWDTKLMSYFYKSKTEKEEYIIFLKEILNYAKENIVFQEFLDKIETDINLIYNNNINPKNIVIKNLIEIKNFKYDS